ncbi:heterokaryon incompatibility protein-domain-containing protein [Melanogaster broomeanus]|nr:heterokaryon incompatibility protein-domain-containing protein [Melanogaster broomeanus]
MPRKAKASKSSSSPQPKRRAAKACSIQVGHVIQSCPYLSQGKRQGDFSGVTLPVNLETARLSATFDTSSSPTAASSAQSLCQRCKHQNILSCFATALPFTLDDKDPDHSNRAKRKISQIPLTTCPLCRIIFDITCLAGDDLRDITAPIHGPKCQLVLVLGWTMNRLERDLRWPEYAKGEGPYAKCLYTSVINSIEEVYARAVLVDWAIDAIGVEEILQGSGEGSGALGLKKVGSTAPDYGMIKGWLHRCDDLHHITCWPTWSEDLRKIKLLDAETREIVMYPLSGCDYITLSYVWGGVVQHSYKLGDVLPAVSLPATIEDAMVVTQSLGKRYLWVDSLCIEQDNEAEKVVQIGLMSVIYNGAWASIICVSGQSAQSRIPRVGTSDNVIPQLSCEIDGKRLLSTMPTLSHQLSQSPWAKRAWTFQEGLLSPRRVFFTRHQVYFECNAAQCCESLDDSNSPFHLQSDEQRQNEKLPAYLDSDH